MRRVENHRRAGGSRQDRQRAHVRHQRVVAERGAALGHQHIAIAGAGDLGDHIRHVPRRKKLAFLYVDDFAGRRRGQQQIGLPAKKRRNLQDIDGLRDLRALRGSCTSVSTGNPRCADFGEDRQRLPQADAARRRRAGAVRLIERGLVDEADLRAAPRSPSARQRPPTRARGSPAGTGRR